MTQTRAPSSQIHETDTSRRIRGSRVDRDNAVLDRQDLAKKHYGTLLECAERVGPEWLAASLCVQQNGWNDSLADGDEAVNA